MKKSGGQSVISGNIIIRQKGNKFHPGVGVSQGNDYTIFATTVGKVSFRKKLSKNYVDVV